MKDSTRNRSVDIRSVHTIEQGCTFVFMTDYVPINSATWLFVVFCMYPCMCLYSRFKFLNVSLKYSFGLVWLSSLHSLKRPQPSLTNITRAETYQKNTDKPRRPVVSIATSISPLNPIPRFHAPINPGSKPCCP